jgi:ribosomal protein S18 acetylase RimI-like enzyme
MMIEKLNWDSLFFNRNIGRMNVSGQLGSEQLGALFSCAFDTVYLICDERQSSLENQSVLLADEKLTFIRYVDRTMLSTESYYNVTQDNKELRSIFLLSGHQSRFYFDSVFNSQFENLYNAWFENSLQRSFADFFCATGTIDNPSGLIVLKKLNNSLEISIISVAEVCKGKGLGRSLVHIANNIALNEGLGYLQVVTQARNNDAIAFYYKLGFELNQRKFIYHWHR